MDDPNNTNQPLDPSMPPTVPSVPEDITPQSVPPATVPEPTVPVLPPVEMPFPEPTPGPAVTTEVPVPVTTPLTPPLPGVPTPVQEEHTSDSAQQTPPVADVPMPKGKSKKKILPIIGGIMALLLVVGVAGAAYYVSNQLAKRQAVAPNAPESKPAASCGCTLGEYVAMGTGCASGWDGCGYKVINGESVNACCCACGGGGGDEECPVAGTCPTTCHTDTQTVPDGSCGETTCAPNAPAADTCPTACNYAGGTVPNGSCGETTCDAGSCPTGSTCNTDGTCEGCPVAETCPITCGFAGGTTVPNGSCGTTECLETEACSEEVSCLIINIYKKVNEQYGTTPLTASDLENLKVGDSLKFTTVSNTDSVFGRYRVTIDDVPGEWLWGTFTDADKKLNVYNDYIVQTLGVYKFETQVSTTATPY